MSNLRGVFFRFVFIFSSPSKFIAPRLSRINGLIRGGLVLLRGSFILFCKNKIKERNKEKYLF